MELQPSRCSADRAGSNAYLDVIPAHSSLTLPGSLAERPFARLKPVPSSR